MKRTSKQFTKHLRSFGLHLLLGIILFILVLKSSRTTVDIEDTKNPSCSFLGIKHIRRVGMTESIAVNDETWNHGQYPYSLCPKPTGAVASVKGEIQKTVVLTVMDTNYLEVLPAWAEHVRSIGLDCHVVGVDAKTCVVAAISSCGCFDSSAVPDKDVRRTGWYTNRVRSVKLRFVGALNILKSGRSVLMHDADVLFQADGLENIARYLGAVREASSRYNFMVQDNGQRKENYDGLNWGFVWMESSTPSIATLECTLERWEDQAFGCGTRDNCHSYYLRSQPRINHVLELAMASSKRQTVSACRLPPLKSFGIVHMTGYPTVAAKLTCAKANGYIPTNVELPRLAYESSPNVDIFTQRKVLQAAISFAHATGRKLEIPDVFHLGMKRKFCDMFDVSAISDYLTSRTSTKCFETYDDTTDLSALNKTRHKKICFDFKYLIERALAQKLLGVPICDPENPAYKKIHCCERRDGTDELFP